MNKDFETIQCCRSCNSVFLSNIVELGAMPLVDRLGHPDENPTDEPRFPLTLAFCNQCSLVQIKETVAPEILFGTDYPYYSSFSTSWLQHSRNNALQLAERKSLDENNLVVELASNDGYLLKNFVSMGIPVLGIDPAPGPAQRAMDCGVPTRIQFFGESYAEQLADEGIRADVVIANNVLAHVRDLNGFVRGLKKLLKPSGLIAIEVPYVKSLIEHCEFDTIYHEHLCYFSVFALRYLFRQAGLAITDIEQLSTHGGSLRIYAEHEDNVLAISSKVFQLIQEEVDAGIAGMEFYRDFADKIERANSDLRSLLTKIKSENGTIAAYGAAAKGALRLNAAGISTDEIDYVVDRNTHKQGWMLPGVRIPIEAPEKILETQPDYLLILPWNLKDEIVSQQKEYEANGGKFILPVDPTRKSA